MVWESWIVIAVFVINLTFLFIMSFVSPYFKALLSKGIGKVYNIIWMCVIVAAAGVLLFYNTQCNISTDVDIKAINCKRLAIAIVVFLVLLTILNMSWAIYNTIEYDKQKKPSSVASKPTTQEQKRV